MRVHENHITGFNFLSFWLGRIAFAPHAILWWPVLLLFLRGLRLSWYSYTARITQLIAEHGHHYVEVVLLVRLITLHGRLLENLLLKNLKLLLKKEHLSGINHSWWHRWWVSAKSLLTLVRNVAGAPLAIVLVELVPRQALLRLVLGCRGLAYGNEIATRLLLLRFW